MPLYKLIAEPNHEVIALWNVSETNEALLSLLKSKNILYEIPASYKHEHRKKEWLAVRLLLHEMFLTHDEIKLKYDDFGKPSLENMEGNISISHSGSFIAIVYHKTLHTGIDVERITPRIEKIAYKFLNDNERKFVEGEKSLEKLYVIWGAKESLFKWYGKGSLDFKENFNVLPFHYNNRGIITAQFILNKDIRDINLHYHQFEDVMLVHVVN